jgi:hypothetical protein
MLRPSHSSTNDSVRNATLVGSSGTDGGFTVECKYCNWEI